MCHLLTCLCWTKLPVISCIESIENVQRKFTKRLPGFSQYSYQDRLKRLSLPSLELRRLLHDLILCYKIVFGLINVQCDEFFTFSMLCTRGHPYKLTKYSRSTSCHSQFFSQRIVNVWNSLPNNTVDFTSLRSFKRSINNVNYSEFLKVFLSLLFAFLLLFFFYYSSQRFIIVSNV